MLLTLLYCGNAMADAASVPGTIPAKPESDKYLTFTAEAKGSTFSLINTKQEEPNLEYSTDGGETWTTIHASETVTLENVGDVVKLRGTNPNGFSGFPEPAYFTMTGRIAASGSVMSLVDGTGESTTIPSDGCFASLFQYSCLTKAPELPATELETRCYSSMFKCCVYLEEVPELPATDLTYDCYYDMFDSCIILSKAPQLPATELKAGCYSFMFKDCTALTDAPELPATKIADSCYMSMFEGCRILTKGPELPATELRNYCYKDMFNGCYNLNYIKVGIMTLDNDRTETTYNWVKDVDKEGVFVFPCGSIYDKHGISEVPMNFEIKSSVTVVFQNPDETELWRETIECGETPTYKGETPTYGEGCFFKSWNKEFTELTEPGTYYYTAQYDKGVETGVETSASDNCTVWTEGLNIIVRGAQDNILIYSLNGQLIHSAEGDADKAVSFPMSAHGTYIVKTGKRSFTVEL